VVDHQAELAGGSTLPGGPLDEVAHLLTTLVVLRALGVPLSTRFARAALVMSVLIDLDHVPARLGSQFLTAGTPRPYTHSLLTVLVLLGLAVWPRWRVVFLGAAFGLVVHLWRDLSESGSAVSLLWPITNHPTRSSHTAYVVAIMVLAAVAVLRLNADRRHTLGRSELPRPVGQGDHRPRDSGPARPAG
jgi:membrane-bound metal-dependent hydrolase YbcI (DUF457 family)